MSFVFGFTSVLYTVFGSDLIFWSAVTALGAYKVARILYSHQHVCSSPNCGGMPPLIKEEEEYEDDVEVEEEEEMKVE